MASNLSDLLVPTARTPAGASWNGSYFEILCACSLKMDSSPQSRPAGNPWPARNICAHIEDFYASLGDVQFCQNTDLNLFDHGRHVMLPFAQDEWVGCRLRALDLSRGLFTATEQIIDLRDDGSTIARDGFEAIIGKDESFVGYVRALQDHYRATAEYDAVMESLMSRRVLPCDIPGHRRPSADVAFAKELKAYVALYLNSYGMPDHEVARCIKTWSAEEMEPAFRQVALKQARYLIHRWMCSICWRFNTRPGNVDPDLIPSL